MLVYHPIASRDAIHTVPHRDMVLCTLSRICMHLPSPHGLHYSIVHEPRVHWPGMRCTPACSLRVE